MCCHPLVREVKSLLQWRRSLTLDSLSPQQTGEPSARRRARVAGANADLNILLGAGRARLSRAVVAPTDRAAILQERAGVFTARADRHDSLKCRRRRLPTVIPNPSRRPWRRLEGRRCATRPKSYRRRSFPPCGRRRPDHSRCHPSSTGEPSERSPHACPYPALIEASLVPAGRVEVPAPPALRRAVESGSHRCERRRR